MTIDSVFLKEYQKREMGYLKKNIPICQRFQYKAPVFNIVEFGSKSVWSQIALSGTALIPLYPVPSEYFKRMWNISESDIPNLIQFIKETNKIQFFLTGAPIEYEKYDYLEPILREFGPPLYMSNLNIKDPKFQVILKQSLSEIKMLIDSSPEWKRKISAPAGQEIIKSHIKAYTTLQYYGLYEMADVFIQNFLINPDYADDYLWIAEKMVLHPIDDPIKANLALNISTIQKANQLGISSPSSLQRSIFPEIGSFLMKKCIHYPDSFEACKVLINCYEENDLYKVHSSLNEAVNNRDDSSIIQKSDEMGEILENVWEDTTIRSNAATYNFGITATCGIIGYSIGGGFGGLMASLGLKCIEKSGHLNQFSELIAKKIATPYMATIYDFKSKYPLR
jgi:hypothetical protein